MLLALSSSGQSLTTLARRYGTPDTQGSNLATCVWTSREAARAASSLPLHAKAAAKSRKAYATFELGRYKLSKHAGETRLRIDEWREGDELAEQEWDL